MQNLFLILLLSIFSLGVNAQSEKFDNTAAPGVEEIYLAKDEAGEAGAAVESFSTLDVPIHCVVRLDSTKIVRVKMNFVAENVPGVKPETQVISVVYKTDGKQNQVNFTGKPEKFWTAGDYRIDVYIDETTAASKRFVIKKLPNATEKIPLQKIKNFAPVKPKPVQRVKKAGRS